MEVWVLTSSSHFSRWENNAAGIADRRIWVALPYTSLAGGTRTFQQIFRQISLAWFLTISDANRTAFSNVVCVIHALQPFCFEYKEHANHKGALGI